MKKEGRDVAWFKCSLCRGDSIFGHKDGCVAAFDIPVYWYQDKPVERGFNDRNGKFAFDGED